ncbi:MAG: SEC-C metal-binding domain-containing protein [Candidatus Sumerlaeota bacterium]|nr:SEC-C metal-binding domain-containing protein [Candidatus Sumerlaeota bacterium]
MPNVGRNDPCPCGSGKKYKKCCGASVQSAGGAVQSAQSPVSAAGAQPAKPSEGALSSQDEKAALFAPAKCQKCPPYLVRRPTPGQPNERVLFINSIGGLGDSFLMPAAMALYKKFHPQDTAILFDSLFFHRYYEQPPYVDEIYRASEHLYANYAPQMILNMDEALPRDGGMKLSEVNFTRFASTHHAHGRTFDPPEIVIKMDWCTLLGDAILQGLMPLRLQLKSRYAAQVDAIMKQLNPEGRMLAVIQNRGANAYKTLQVEGAQYKRELETLAEMIVARHGARILLCGDVKLESPERFAKGDWIDLDAAVKNIYFKFEILRRCDYLFAAPSGFSWIANLMRGPEQSPAMLLYGSKRMLYNEDFLEYYPKYVAEGGGLKNNLIAWSYQHPALWDFLFDMPHSPEKTLAFMERLIEERRR